MVAVIAGNGLGLGNTSLRQLGQGLGGQAAIGQNGVDQYLNAATGNLVLQNADEGLIFDGLSLNVLRTYNSQGQLTGNQGWLFGFSRSVGGLTGALDTAGSTITRTGDDGAAVVYAYDTGLGRYVSTGQSGALDTLSWNAGSSSWTGLDAAQARQETYDAGGQLTALSDTRTSASYSFSYSNGQLSQITAGDGDTLLFGYNASNQLISLSIQQVPPGQTSAVMRQQVGYTYDAQGRLSTIATTLASDTHSSTASYTTTYTYDGTSDRVASVSQSDGTVASYTYAADANGLYRVASITTGSGTAAQVLTLSYDLGSDATTVTNALGQAWTYSYNAAGQLSAVHAPSVNGSAPATTYQYDVNGNLLQTTDANGGITSYSYDTGGNLLSVEDATGHTVSTTYSADDQVLSRTTYTTPALGVAGQPGYVAPSGAQTTYYVYDASDRLSYVVDPLGSVTEHDYSTVNGLAVLSSTRQYLGASYDVTGLSPGAPPSLLDLQNWVASAPVQGTLNQGARTDYSYDVRGQLTLQTQWDSLGSNGTGTLAGDIGATVKTYSYDAQGRLLQTATERGSNRTTLETTSYAYDGLGRLVGRTDPLGNVTSYLYTDSGNTLAIIQANGLTTTQVRNSAGQLIGSTQSAGGQASRVTTYLYDAAGQNVATIDPAGNASYTFHDADGRVAGTVDATGAVTAYAYDADGHVIGTTQYATAVDTGGWISGGALTASLPASLPVPTATASDRTHRVIVDAAGRAVATIDALGNATTTVYDGNGNAVAHTAYATALTQAQLGTLGSAPTLATLQAMLSSSVNDRSSHVIYDADGRSAATIDAGGFVTTITRDGAGGVVKTVAYATALTPAQLAALGSTPSLAALQPYLVANANDQTSRTYYDDAGRVVAQVDADGYLTTMAYDATTHTETTTRYAVALTSGQLAALSGHESVATLVGLLGGATGNQQSSITYNADNQVVSAIAADGTVTTNGYDSVGQLLHTTVTPTVGQGAARTTSATYDAFGDTLTAVDGAAATTTYTYNVLGQRTTTTDALGNISYVYYDAAGRVAYAVQGQPSGGTRNALGNVTANHYNALGQLTSTRRYASQLTLTGGSSSGTTLNPATATLAQVAAAVAALPVSASDADGLTTYSYTLDGQLASSTDGLGYQTANSYDAFGDRTQVQQQLSQPGLALSAGDSTISTFAYDARGEQVGETDAVGRSRQRSTSRAYDAFGRVIRRTDANGNILSTSYDALGRQVSSSQVVDGTARITQTTYDAFARTVTQIDALGNTTVYQYDLANHKRIVTTPDGVQLTVISDAHGDTVEVTDGAGNSTTYTYDGDGRRLTSTDALGHVGSNQYDAAGDLIRTTDATGHVIAIGYDAGGRVLTRTVDPGGLALTTTYSYDGEGRALSVTDPQGSVTTYAYDADGQVLTQVQDAGSGRLNLTTTHTYDGAGKTLTVTVGAGTSAARTTQYVYDNLERLYQRIVDPGSSPHLNLTTTYVYDGNDNLTSVTDANGHVTLSVYDEANAKVFGIDAAGAVTQTSYDADGRVTAVRAYATALTATQLAALGTAPTVAAVAPTVAVDDAVSYTAYNAEGQVRYSIDPLGYVTETRYDAAGRVSETLAYANAVSVSAGEATILETAQATALSSLNTLVGGAGNTDATAQATLHLYDADGRARFVVRQNTVDGQLVGQVDEQRFDAAGRVIATVAYGSTLPLSTGSALSAQLTTGSVTLALAGAPMHISQNVYDNAGRLRYVIDTTGQVTETQYDAAGRVLERLEYANPIVVPGTLTEASVGAAVAAAGVAGARFSSSTYDAAGRVLATADALGTNATYTYDATGLQLSRTNRDGAVTVTTYDAAGRKQQVQSPAVTVGSYVSGTGAFQSAANQYLYTTYAYDGVGNVASISQGSGASAGAITALSTTAYAYDAVNHQIQTTYPGGISTHVVYDALGQAVVDQDANGHYQSRVYNADGQVAYAVDADGYVTGTGYDAYGNVTSITRYATALNTAAIAGWSIGQPLTLAQLRQGLATSASDRTIATNYDQRDQKTQVLQTAIGYVLSVTSLAGTAMAAAQPTTTYAYDAYGNVTSTSTLIQGADGTTTPAIWATTYTYYDARNRVVLAVTPFTRTQGYVTATAYSGLGDVLSTTQYATAIAVGGLTAATPPAVPAAAATDRTTSYGYDAIGRKVSQTDTGLYSYVNGTPGQTTGSSVTTIGYDGENRVTRLTVNGMTTATAYDAAGRVISVTAPARQVLVSNWQTLLQTTPADDLTTAALYTTASPVTSYVYDALGNALSTTVAAGGLSQQSWSTFDALGRQTAQTDANGNVTTMTYDANGNRLTQAGTLTGNGTPVTVTSTYTYDADNQQLSTAVQRSGQSGYDSYTQVKYNAFGEVVAKGDNIGYAASYGYDNAGNLISAPDATTGAIHTYAYDLANRQVTDTSTVTGGGATTGTRNVLDVAGRTVARYVPSDSTGAGAGATPIDISHDRWGNVLAVTDAAGNSTQYQYDSQNKLIHEIEPNVLVVSASGTRTWTTPSKSWYYNVSGQLIGVTDENGNTSWNTYDAAGNLSIAQDAIGARTYTAYDALGRAVAQQTPPANTATGPVAHITYTGYDNLNQVTAQGDFLLDSAGTARTQQAQQTYTLNSQGDRIQVADALGNTSFYDYDSQHRILSSQTSTQHANGWAETFTYDANGHKTGDTTANGDHQSWVVDYYGRVQSHVDLSGATTSYTYDAGSGLLTGETSNWAPTGQTNPGYLPASLTGSGSGEQYQYFADGQVARVTQTTGGVTAQWDTYQYDLNGNRTVDATYTTDGAGQAVHTETVASYDSHNRLSVETTENPDTGVASSRLVYNYDAVGNRRAVFAESAYGATASPIGGNGGAPTGALGGQTATAGQAWNFSAAAGFVDNVGFGLTFAATQSDGSALPSWMTFNSSGAFSGTPPTAGSWTISVAATDVLGQTASATFTLTVTTPANVAPVLSATLTNQVVVVNTAMVTYAAPAATDTDGDTISYSATGLPAGITFNPVTRTFSGTPTVTGTSTVTYTATDSRGAAVSATFTITVNAPANVAPVLSAALTNQTVVVNTAMVAYVAPAATDTDGDTISYSATGLPAGITFNASTRTFSGTPTVTGTSTVTYTATDSRGAAVSATFTITATTAQLPPVYHGGYTNQTGMIGSPLTIPEPSGAFTSPGGQAITYSAMVLIPQHMLDYWNSGDTEILTRTVAAQWVAIGNVGLGINASTGTISGVPTTLNFLTSSVSNSYQHLSSYQLEVIGTNAYGSVSAQFTLTNSFAPPAVQGSIPTQTTTPGSVWRYTIPSTLFSDPYGHGLTYTSNAPAWMGFSAGSFTSALLQPAGTYSVTITATDGLGRTASAVMTVVVPNVAPVFTAAPSNLTAVSGTAMAAYVAPAATDNNGDAITYSATALPAGIAFNASTRTFSGTPTTAGTSTVTYTATDSHGAATHATFTITVSAPLNLPPVYNGGIPATVVLDVSGGTSASWTVPATAFSSPSGEALTYAALLSSGVALPTWLTFNAGTRTFTSPVRLADSTWTITVKATDTQGRSVGQTFTLDVYGTGSTSKLAATLPTSKGKGAKAHSFKTQSITTATTSAHSFKTAAVTTQSTATTLATSTTSANLQSYWFTYDADNRVVVSNGALVNGAITITAGSYLTPSVANQYDAAGNVVVRNTINASTYTYLSAYLSGTTVKTYDAGDTMSQRLVYDARNALVESDYATDLTHNEASLGAQQLTNVDADGRQISTYSYMRNDAVQEVYGTRELPYGDYYLDTPGWITQGQTTSYTADGQVSVQSNLTSNYDWVNLASRDEEGLSLPTGTDPALLAVASTTTTTGFDRAGNVTAYSYASTLPSVFGANYTVQYLKKDGYL
ncbi:MAG: putative Ig domain-containing protein, partial [Pseudomonadota bacterium]|nr:putative Ig domain-containing protein [Pseudomonadota bacterium]